MSSRDPGQRNGFAKLTDAEVLAIKQRLVAGERPRKLARQFGVSDSCVTHIKRGRWWKHIAPTGLEHIPPYSRGELAGSAKLTTEQALAIRRRSLNGATVRRLAEEFSISKSQVGRIRLGQDWRHLEGQP